MVVLAVLIWYSAPANDSPLVVVVIIIVISTLIIMITIIITLIIITITVTTLSITEHPLTQVSLQRLEQFLLEGETERLDSFTQGTPAPPSQNAGGVGPKIVIRNASFGPAAGEFQRPPLIYFLYATYVALQCASSSHRYGGYDRGMYHLSFKSVSSCQGFFSLCMSGISVSALHGFFNHCN